MIESERRSFAGVLYRLGRKRLVKPVKETATASDSIIIIIITIINNNNSSSK